MTFPFFNKLHFVFLAHTCVHNFNRKIPKKYFLRLTAVIVLEVLLILLEHAPMQNINHLAIRIFSCVASSKRYEGLSYRGEKVCSYV